MTLFEESVDINGRKLTLQGGKLAKQATSSVFARMGDTCVLVTVTAGKEKPDLDYFPLQVEYSEKLYAGGRIKGSRWVKREGRPSDDAILIARLIDRSIRPLFSSSYRREVQVIVTLLSVDGVHSPDMLSSIAVSAALHISPIPWNGPISMTRVGYVKNAEGDTFIANPNEEEQAFSSLDLVVSSTKNRVNMIETKAEEIAEEIVLKAIVVAKKENDLIIDFIEKLRKKVGQEKWPTPPDLFDKKLLDMLKKNYKKQIEQLLADKAQKEYDNGDLLNKLVSEVMETIKDDEYDRKLVAKAIDYLTKQTLREKILTTKKRADGRGLDEIRPISAEVSILPRTHGSAIFQRGDTQVLSIVTLGAPSMEQLIESPEGEEAKSYIHHYYMPPYSVGETGRVGFPSRREIGHGALAEKAIEPVLPSAKDFPYTIRVVSEVLSSNGSTSMASTCGSALALMDAGVPIKSPVSGIAMGLITGANDEYVVLTDIMGIEDFSGDMDFKMAGSKTGVTAVQLDVKIEGLTQEMIEEIVAKSKKARLFILEKMNAAIKTPRKELSKFAPKVVVLTPPADKIGEIIGPGGRNIRNLIARTETDINVSDDGKVTITGIDKVKVAEAVAQIENLTREVQAGEEFDGEVKRILPFGAFVELFAGKEGMVHVSKMANRFVKDPNEIVKIGQKVRVKVIEVDKMGRINLQLLGIE